MTRDRVRAEQSSDASNPVQMLRVQIVSTGPLVIELPGGAHVPGLAVAGLTYVPGATAHVLVQLPAIGPVFPHA